MTDNTDISTVHVYLHWILNYWELVVILLGAGTAAFLFWLKTIFATKAHMENCRVDMIDSYDEKLEKYHKENRAEHREMREDVKAVLHHLIGKE